MMALAALRFEARLGSSLGVSVQSTEYRVEVRRSQCESGESGDDDWSCIHH